MPSRRRPLGGRDANAADADHDAEVAKADEELARAEVRAEEARARLAGLPWQRAWSLESPGAADGADEIALAGSYDDEPDDRDVEPLAERSNRWQPPRLRRPGRKAGALAAAIVVVGASLGGSMFMELEHRALLRNQHRSAEFGAAAREGVIRLMSIDANHAEEDVQRNIDNSTGELREQLRITGGDLAQKAVQSKISTKASVDAVAVESTADDSGIILVLARSESFYPDDGKRVMNTWRISVKMTRVGGQLKMAKVDFLQ